eukprot:89875-Lingulodinium_polyedra.AAC.1
MGPTPCGCPARAELDLLETLALLDGDARRDDQVHAAPIVPGPPRPRGSPAANAARLATRDAV